MPRNIPIWAFFDSYASSRWKIPQETIDKSKEKPSSRRPSDMQAFEHSNKPLHPIRLNPRTVQSQDICPKPEPAVNVD